MGKTASQILKSTPRCSSPVHVIVSDKLGAEMEHHRQRQQVSIALCINDPCLHPSGGICYNPNLPSKNQVTGRVSHRHRAIEGHRNKHLTVAFAVSGGCVCGQEGLGRAPVAFASRGRANPKFQSTRVGRDLFSASPASSFAFSISSLPASLSLSD